MSVQTGPMRLGVLCSLIRLTVGGAEVLVSRPAPVLLLARDIRASNGRVMSFLVIAHRGYSSEAPENTLPAFDLAVSRGFRHVELDVQLTADGVPIVIHDATLNRTTDGSGPVSKATLSDILGLDAGSWFGDRSYRGVGVPTLSEVLARYSANLHLHIELKSTQSELPKKVFDLLERHGWQHGSTADPSAVPGLTISSFHALQLRRSRSLMPEYPPARPPTVSNHFPGGST